MDVSSTVRVPEQAVLDPIGVPPPEFERLHILGAPVDVVDMPGALRFVDRCVREERPTCSIAAMNPEKVYSLRRSSRLRLFFESANLVLPDGIGIVLAARLLHGRGMHRVPGADVLQCICAAAPGRAYRIFVFGASEEINAAAVAKLRQHYRGINIVGRANGYLRREENDALVRAINDSRADILFVALGSPRQEFWMLDNMSRLKVGICQGVGGALDTVAGKVKRAPQSWQAVGCEWAYRLLHQPSRILRYAALLRFAVELALAKAAQVWKG